MKFDKYTERAFKDRKFREKLLLNANRAIEEEFSEKADFMITYHESDSKHLVFCIPAHVENLDEEELEMVAGGTGETEQTEQSDTKTDNQPVVQRPRLVLPKDGSRCVPLYACYPGIRITSVPK